ncbi:CotH kinase family protein [Myxococcaceae bacterium GXIMD 01537]
MASRARRIWCVLLCVACVLAAGCDGAPALRCEEELPGSAALGPDEEDGLPVFHLYFPGSLPDDEGYRAARLVYRGICYRVEARYRGNSSSIFPKRSYTLDFPAKAPFNEPRLAGGFTGRRKVVLISPFNDNSYLRNRLAFALWSRMSSAHLEVKTYSAVVYVDGQYLGLYTVADHVDRHFLAAQGLDPAGELFKAVNADANFSRVGRSGDPKLLLHQGYEKKPGPPPEGREAYASIRALTAFVADASPEDFRARWESLLVAREYEDWWVFSTLVYADDSVAKNAYHYRGPGPGARWRFIPWDLDGSFGQHWDTRRVDPGRREDFSGPNHLFARMMADPSIAQPLRERYRALLRGPLRADEVVALLDTYAAEVSAAARKDEARWGGVYRGFIVWSARQDFTTHEEEVAYLREWVRTRWREMEREPP